MGFLDAGHDVDGYFGGVGNGIPLSSRCMWASRIHRCLPAKHDADCGNQVGTTPWLDTWLKKNPILLWFERSTDKLAIRSRALSGERLSHGKPNSDRRDLMSHFLEAKEKRPDVSDDTIMTGYAMTPLIAGLDTTAIFLRSSVYYVSKNPAILVKLQSELDDADLKLPPTYEESNGTPIPGRGHHGVSPLPPN